MGPLKKSQRLLADIGGTNVRLALHSPRGKPRKALSFRKGGYDSLSTAIEDYLGRFPSRPNLCAAAFGVAAPPDKDIIEFTNSPWTFSQRAIREEFGLEKLEVINDFAAVALSVPHLARADRQKIGGGRATPGLPIAVLGPGTGLGVSCLVSTSTSLEILETEGGHVTLAPFDEYEAEVLECLRAEFGHVSAERIVSGPGLANLYMAIAQREEGKATPLKPATISRRAASGECSICVQAADVFSAVLGTVASNLALTVGARGGVYVAGGVVPNMGAAFNHREFRRRFEDKGRMSEYLAAIPTYVITHPAPAFLGLAHLLD